MRPSLSRALPFLERRGASSRVASASVARLGLLDRLSSLTPAVGHTPWLDGWRGLCIALVLLGHFVPVIGRVAPLGVELFFVLSGRLMAELLIVRRQPLPTFVLRRASRILPLLAFYTGVITLGLVVSAVLAGTQVNWLSPVATLLFFGNYVPHPAPMLEHCWSLAVEEHSYLLLVLVAAVSLRKPLAAAGIALVLAGCMMLNGAVLFHDPAMGPAAYWRSDVRGASVLLSFALCLGAHGLEQRAVAARLGWLAPLCAIGALACMYPLGPVTPLRMAGCTMFAALSVNSLQFASVNFRRLLSSPVLTWLGTLSFSLYIWQQPFFIATKGGFPAVLAVPLVFGCAIWSFVRIEAPARRYLNARWDRMRMASFHPLERAARGARD